MKKGFVVGALFGATLMIGLQAGAAGLLQGSKVAGTKNVTLNGHSIGQAAIINNSSYLPVRALSEALDLKIDLSGGAINLAQATPQPVETSEPTPTQVPAATPEPVVYTAEAIDFAILSCESQINHFNATAASYEAEGHAEIAKTYRDYAKRQQEELAVWLQRKADLEAKPKVDSVYFTSP
ncbi:hypothetical protein ACFSR7_36075 [Cohnella sp. GCM10020058]|uniref:hypothetical protein n=1 Tax=Cohnella sp. GCM10020058 TaxID=3317330 RepID=UPI00363BF218